MLWITYVHNDYLFRSTIILWKILYFILFGYSETDFLCGISFVSICRKTEMR